MKKIDEAIEKLQEARLKTGDGECQGLIETAIALLEAAKAGPTGNGWDDIPEIAAMLKEAEPEAGEFTKEFLHLLRLSWGSVGVEGRVRQFGLEACIRLLAQQQEIERLKAENKRLDRWHDYFAWEREMKKVEAKNVRLTAENKRLRGQTDCETKSGGILCIEQEDKILALTERIEKLESAKAEPGESSSCGTLKSLLDQLGRHRNLFDRLVAEKQALTERIERKEKALAVAIKYIGESSSDELAAQYDIKQAVKGEE